MDSKWVLSILCLFISLNTFANQKLIDAVKNSNLSEVENILNNDPSVDINFQDGSGRTPLIYACMKSNNNISSLVFSKKPNPNIQDYKGNTALFYLVSNAYRNDVMNAFFALSPELEIHNHLGMTAFHHFVDLGNYELIHLLYEKGANVNARNNLSGATAIHYAQRGCSDCYISNVKFLLNLGVDINAQDNDGTTVLWQRDPYIVQNLIKLGANVHILDNLGNNALMASENNFKLFLDAGININQQNNDGKTLLHELVKTYKHNLQYSNGDDGRYDLECIEFVIKNGADLKLKDKDGHTAFHYSAMSFYNQKNLLLIKFFIDNGANAFDFDNKGRTALHNNILSPDYHTYLNLDLQTFKYLHNLGININQQDNYGNTVTMYLVDGACTRGSHYPVYDSKEILDYILKQQIDFALRNNKGETLLDIALQWKGKGNCNYFYEAIKKAAGN